MMGCFGYLINFVGGFLFPGYASLGVASFISIPGSLGEIGTCLWLVIVGAKSGKN
jgi:Na+/H+-dicarboxylate symporter